MEPDYEFVYLPSVASTQDEVRSRLEGSPVVVASRSQTAGRGRRGAEWVNADDAMALSIGFALNWPLADIPIVTLTAGVAAVSAIEGPSFLKWPNDIVDRDENKLGGILTESDSSDPSRVVIGIGMNLAWRNPPPGMGALGGEWNDERWLGLAHRIATALLESIGEPGQWPADRYRRHCRTIGSQIKWEPSGSGVATGVDERGGLIVSTSSGETVLRSGTVWSVSGATLPPSSTGRKSDSSQG